MKNMVPDRVVCPDYRLTSREREVLTLAAEGLNRMQIAGRLGLQSLTIGSHLKKIYRKLGVHNRAAAVAIFLRQVFLNDPTHGKLPVTPAARKHLGLPSPPGLNACPHCGANLLGAVRTDVLAHARMPTHEIQ